MHCWIRRTVCSSHGGKTGPRYSSWKRRKGRDSKSVHTRPVSTSFNERLRLRWSLPKRIPAQGNEGVPLTQSSRWEGATRTPKSGGWSRRRDQTAPQWSARARGQMGWLQGFRPGKGQQEHSKKAAPCQRSARCRASYPRAPGPHDRTAPHCSFFPWNTWAGNSETGHNVWEILDPAREGQS